MFEGGNGICRGNSMSENASSNPIENTNFIFKAFAIISVTFVTNLGSCLL